MIIVEIVTEIENVFAEGVAEYISRLAYSALNAVVRKFVDDIENIVYRNVEYVACDIRHIVGAVSPLVAVGLGV